MSPFVDHIWGESLHVDRVWSQVAGMAPSRCDGQPLMVLQAYIDDSYKHDGVFVLAGYIASATEWAEFSREWERLVRWGGTIVEGGTEKHFKMSQMGASPERMERVSAFRKLADERSMLALSCSINIADLKSASIRVSIPGVPIDWGPFSNPNLFCFRALMDRFHTSRDLMQQFIPLDETIDFIFDEQTEKRMILEMWDDYLAKRAPEIRKLYGAYPRFENDRKFRSKRLTFGRGTSESGKRMVFSNLN